MHPRLSRDVHRVGRRRVAPVRLGGELVVGVLAVVDQEVDALAQLEHRVGYDPAVERRLVIGHVGHGAALGLDPEAQRHPTVRDGPGHDLGLPDREVLRPDVDGDQLAPELLHVDGEHGRLHRRMQRVLQAALGLGRPVDGEPGSGIVQWSEERDPQDVVEVQMGQQRSRVQRRPHRAHLRWRTSPRARRPVPRSTMSGSSPSMSITRQDVLPPYRR